MCTPPFPCAMFVRELICRDGDEDTSAALVEMLTSLLCPPKGGGFSYGIDLRSLAITEAKAWYISIDCVVSSLHPLSPPPSLPHLPHLPHFFECRR